MNRRHATKLVIVVILIITGILMELAGLLEPNNMLLVAREYTHYWWLVVVLILLQVILFTFALAGSFFLWIAAPLYPPEMATFILASGGTIGGVSAYLFSKHLTDDWINKVERSRTYKTLQKHNNFFTLFALRLFPAFPHSLVNYSSGILKVKLSHFIPAAVLGLSIKSYIYSRVIYNATTRASIEDLLQVSTYGPLISLSVIVLVGVFIKHKLSN